MRFLLGPFLLISFGILFGGSVFSQSVKADLVILNADVRTMNDKQPRAEAIAIIGNKIIAVGKSDEIRKLVNDATKIVDAKGNLVLPGFNDAHVHFMAIGNTFSSLGLKDITTADEFYVQIRRYVKFLPKGRWILGSGGSNELWGQIHGDALDRLAPDNPVFLYHHDTKSAIANTSAIKAANIKTAMPGVIRSTELEKMIRAVPSDHMKRWREIAETASNYAASLGVTSVQDMDSDDQAAVYKELERAGRLKTRVNDCSSLREWAKNKKPFTEKNTNLVRSGCLKGFHDGDLEDIKWTTTLREDILAADKAGRQIAIHAIGGNATSLVLKIFDEATRSNKRSDRRFRLEHAERIKKADIAKYGKLNIVASIQPYLFGDGAGYSSGYYRDLSRAGFLTAVGSDAPMLQFEPMLAVVSVQKGNGDIMSVIKDHTLTSAFAEFQESVKGSLEAGKYADMVILNFDHKTLTSLTYEGRGQVLDKVMMTIVDGKVVYQANLD